MALDTIDPIHDAADGYGPALGLCAALNVLAALVVVRDKKPRIRLGDSYEFAEYKARRTFQEDFPSTRFDPGAAPWVLT